MSLVAALDQAYAPYVLMILLAFLPNEVWRLLGLVVARGLDETSEWLVFVRAVASALLAGVVAKLLLTPPDALAAVPALFRGGALAAAVVVFFLTKRRVMPAVVVGEAIIVAAAYVQTGN